RGDVAVVEAVEVDAELLHELEGDADALLRHLNGVGFVLPGTDGAAGAERVAAGAAEGVPVGDGEAEVLAHRLAFHLLVGVVVAEGERVCRGRPLVADLLDVREESHGCVTGWRGSNRIVKTTGDRPRKRVRIASPTAS